MLRLARPLGNVARRQLLVRSFAQPIRGYAERNDSMLSSDPSFKPEQPVPSTPTRTAAPIVPSATPATPASTTPIPPANIPREPPPPPQTVVTPPPPGSTPPSNPKIEPAPVTPPPPPPKKRSRVRLLFYLLLLTSLGYAGAVAYALRSDNFHDFFTEYVPFGEDIVLYFEERAFRQRFPNAQANKYRATTVAKDEDKKITIPLRSGLSSREVKEPSGSDVTTKGSHMSAVEDNKAAVTPKKIETQKDTSTKKESNAVAAAKSDAPAAAKKESKPATATPVKESKPEPAATTDDRKPLIAPVTQISPLAVPNAEEPVVQDLVKIVNDLITVINADSTPNTNKYSQPMQKAKDALTQVASQISTLRAAERQAAEERVREAHKEFDEGARTLLERMAVSQREDEIKYREEWDQERSKLASQYENRVKSEVERTQQVLEARHKNDLEELALKMKKDFISSIHSLVESERDNRLSKLSDLSSNVDNLTSLTSNWNGVIDANLATQKLQVAVDAVRSTIENSNATHRPTPFVREMAALKLVADSDPLVDAAIASVPPAAYQRGIPSTAQLIERFRRVAGEVRKASLLPSDAGIASHAASAVLSKVMFSKKGVPQGDDVESILTRTETLLEEGDLDAAAREMNDLKGWPGVLSRDWLGDVRKVLEVKQALEVVETEARLRCLRVE